jgi:GH24 family phage-related lysozyme (muramidase)
MSWFNLSTATISPAGLEMVEYFEGWETKELDAAGNWTGYYTAYKKGEDPWTIGPGLTGHFRVSGKPIEEGTRASHQECVDEMQLRLHNEVYKLVRDFFSPKTQGEFDAAVSFVWNTNQTALQKTYKLPGLVLQTVRLMDTPEGAALRERIISKWVEYKNPKTPFEQGLYRRRIAELCMWFGFPWRFATSAVLERDKRNPDIIKKMTDPFHILEVAQAAAEQEATEKPPEPPKPAPAPKPPEKAKPAPKATPAPPVAVGTKPPSPNTKQPAEVPYKIDPNAGLKPLEESERAVGYFWQNMARLLLRLTGMGTFGTAAAGVANVVQTDAVLGSALMDLTIPVLVLATGVAIAFVSKQYGDWRRARGEASAQQGLY